MDPRELSKIPFSFNEKFGKKFSFEYTIPSENKNRTMPLNENGTALLVSPQIANLVSELTPYNLEIKPADELNSLENAKKTGFAIWIAITFAPISIVIVFLRRH